MIPTTTTAATPTTITPTTTKTTTMTAHTTPAAAAGAAAVATPRHHANTFENKAAPLKPAGGSGGGGGGGGVIIGDESGLFNFCAQPTCHQMLYDDLVPMDLVGKPTSESMSNPNRSKVQDKGKGQGKASYKPPYLDHKLVRYCRNCQFSTEISQPQAFSLMH